MSISFEDAWKMALVVDGFAILLSAVGLILISLIGLTLYAIGSGDGAFAWMLSGLPKVIMIDLLIGPILLMILAFRGWCLD